MLNISELKSILKSIDGRGYKAYKDIKNVYDAADYILHIDHVQGDPFAAASRIRVVVRQKTACFPDDTYKNTSREIALRDFLTRKFYSSIKKNCRGIRGTGKSGDISIDCPTQEILERTSAFITKKHVEIRFLMAMPAFGRKIAGRIAIDMFFNELPVIVKSALLYDNLNSEELYNHIETSEDADYLREQLSETGLISFVADGSILPRKSGIDSKPLKKGKIIPFKSPESVSYKINLPNAGGITGMGIKKGITLIVGGGYHGKSTLLNAIELGVYNHIPGDGREFVITNSNAVKIRAEDGRRIEKVCISPFISNLPFNQDTDSFCSDDASGSTSQSANIIESIETGAEVLLIDEDTSATNFMIRDHRMQELVSKDREPITPFIDKAAHLFNELGISTLLVIGGSGDYFDIADNVICMVEYRPVEITAEARSIAEKYRAERKYEGGESFGHLIERIPVPDSFDPSRGKKDVKIDTRGLQTIQFGTNTIDLSAIEQLVDRSQTRAIAHALFYAKKHMDEEKTLNEISKLVINDLKDKGLDILSPWPVGDYAIFRKLEFAAAINRLRTLTVKQKK